MKNYFKGMGFKVQIMMAISIIAIVSIVEVFAIKNFKEEVHTVNQNYLLDLASSSGSALDIALGMFPEWIDSPEVLDKFLGDIALEGVSSSYAYMAAVNSDYTMLYHPTAEKIGEPVSNDAVKGIINDLMAGKSVENKCIQYTYKGAEKYAGYYVSQSGQFVVIVGADYDEINEPIKNTTSQLTIFAIILAVVALLVCVFICIKIFAPLKAATKQLNKLASLDLAEVPDSKRSDECGDIQRGIKSLRDNLYTMVTTIETVSSSLSENATGFVTSFDNITGNLEHVDSSVLEIAEGATSQAQETASSAEQVQGIDEAIESNLNTVSKLKDSANDMNTMANSAITELKALVESCDRQKDSITVLSEQTLHTNDSAKTIQEAVSMITSIASQTNLLSLNASIEAARAGEAGRGFAVVADEIRNLSENSRQSADTIANIVAELLHNSEVSVATIGEVEKATEDQLARLAETQASFDNLINEIKSVNSNTDNVSEGSATLKTLNANISAAIETLSSISEEYAATTQETSANMQTVSAEVSDCVTMSHDLQSLSGQLIDEISKFKY